jgi:hypothetical protein
MLTHHICPAPESNGVIPHLIWREIPEGRADVHHAPRDFISWVLRLVKQTCCTANAPPDSKKNSNHFDMSRPRVERGSSALQHLGDFRWSGCAPCTAGLYMLGSEVG